MAFCGEYGDYCENIDVLNMDALCIVDGFDYEGLFGTRNSYFIEPRCTEYLYAEYGTQFCTDHADFCDDYGPALYQICYSDMTELGFSDLYQTLLGEACSSLDKEAINAAVCNSYQDLCVTSSTSSALTPDLSQICNLDFMNSYTFDSEPLDELYELFNECEDYMARVVCTAELSFCDEEANPIIEAVCNSDTNIFEQFGVDIEKECALMQGTQSLCEVEAYQQYCDDGYVTDMVPICIDLGMQGMGFSDEIGYACQFEYWEYHDTSFPWFPETICEIENYCNDFGPDFSVICAEGADYSAITSFIPESTCESMDISTQICALAADQCPYGIPDLEQLC